MGSSRLTRADWNQYSTTNIQNQSVHQIYNSRFLQEELDPSKISIRESRDSRANPESTAIIIGLDITGSMSDLHEVSIRSLGAFVTEMYNRVPVTDPHIMFMGIGDVFTDSAPLQVTQFEADIKIAEQLTKIYMEHGGGGNGEESYTLPWYFAARKTAIDCFEKRDKKGYLFTIGDDGPSMVMPQNILNKLVKDEAEKNYTAKELLTMVSNKYNVFHIHMGRGRLNLHSKWTSLLGENAFVLNDVSKLPEVIISRIQLNEGMSPDEILESWNEESREEIRSSINLRR